MAVVSYISEDRLREAEALCKQFLRANRTHVEGMRLLAEIATRNKVYEDAEFLLESCVEFEPGHRAAGMQYANLLLKVQKFSKALAVSEQLLDRFPQDADRIRPLYSAACAGTGRNEAAVEGYRILMRQQPGNPFYPVVLGHVTSPTARPTGRGPVPAGLRHQGRLRGRLLEPGEHEILSVYGRRADPDGGDGAASRHRRPWTGFNCASRSARPTKTAANTNAPSPATPGATP